MTYANQPYLSRNCQYSDELYHYGVLGMKWGIRRYQNPDGSLTTAGKKHYDKTGEYGYHYKSFGTGHNERKSARTQNKIEKAKEMGNQKKVEKLQLKKDKYDYRAERSRSLDRQEEAYARSVKVGGNILARSLTRVGSKPYQQWMAMTGNGNRKSLGKKILSDLLAGGFNIPIIGTIGGRLLSTTAKAVYMRSGEPTKNSH